MEARIYKPKRLRNGKRTIGRLYRARVKLTGDNKVRDIALQVSDKQVAQQKLNKLIQELEHESAGLIPAKVEREAAQSPLLDLVSEYVNELTVLGRSADHLRHVDKRLRRLVRETDGQQNGRSGGGERRSEDERVSAGLGKGGHPVSGRARTPHGLSCVADDVYHPAFDHESASALGDGISAA